MCSCCPTCERCKQNARAPLYIGNSRQCDPSNHSKSIISSGRLQKGGFTVEERAGRQGVYYGLCYPPRIVWRTLLQHISDGRSTCIWLSGKTCVQYDCHYGLCCPPRIAGCPLLHHTSISKQPGVTCLRRLGGCLLGAYSIVHLLR